MKKIILYIFYFIGGILTVGGSFFVILGLIKKNDQGVWDILVAVGGMALLLGLIILLIGFLIYKFLVK